MGDTVTAPLDLDALAKDAAEVLSDLTLLGAFVRIPNNVVGQPEITDFAYDRWTPSQRAFHAARTGRDVVLKSRQSFFSTLEILRDIQYARTHEGAQVLIVTDDRDEKEKFFDRLKMMTDSLEAWGLIPAPRSTTKTQIVWPDNYSGIYITEAGASEGAAQSTGRSGTIHRAHLTEAAFWKSPRATWTSLSGAMDRADEVVIETTARGADTWFHRLWKAAVTGRFGRWRAHFFPWFEHPGRTADPKMYGRPTTSRARKWERILVNLGISRDQLAWWRGKVETMTLDKALQEYPPTADAAFVSPGDTWLEPEYLDALGDAEGKPKRHKKLKRGELRIWINPDPAGRYIIGGDVSDGVGGDAATLVVIDHRTGKVCAAWHDRWTKPKEYARVMADVGLMYSTALLAPERQGMRTDGKEAIGLAVLRTLRELKYPSKRIYKCEKDKPGWSTDKETRPTLLGDMADGIQDGSLRTPDAATIAETRSLVKDRNGKIRARGKTSGRSSETRGDDGLFFAWAIAVQVRIRKPIRSKRLPRIIPVGQLDSVDFRT